MNSKAKQLRNTGFRADKVKADYLEGKKSLKEAADLLECYGFWRDQAELWLKSED